MSKVPSSVGPKKKERTASMVDKNALISVGLKQLTRKSTNSTTNVTVAASATNSIIEIPSKKKGSMKLLTRNQVILPLLLVPRTKQHAKTMIE